MSILGVDFCGVIIKDAISTKLSLIEYTAWWLSWLRRLYYVVTTEESWVRIPVVPGKNSDQKLECVSFAGDIIHSLGCCASPA